MTTSLALTTPTQTGGWDLFLDSSNNLALVTQANELAQDVASAVRTFLGECWYDFTLGVPYFQQIFVGHRVSLQFVKQALATAGSIVPGVGSIAVFLTGPGTSRVVGGQLQITSTSGQVLALSAANVSGSLPWWSNAAYQASGSNT